MPTTSWVELIDRKEFAKAALDENLETFEIHILALEGITIFLSQVVKIVALQWEKALTEIPYREIIFGRSRCFGWI